MPLTQKPLQKLFVLLAGLVWAGLPLAAARADNVVEGFSANQTLQPGIVVALDKASTRTVKPTSTSSPTAIYGVVVDPSDAPITLVNQGAQVFVATTGTYQVLVSTANGAIKTGDYLSLSPVNGVAARASSTQPIVLGRAVGSFDGSNNIVANSGGQTIGRVLVSINIQDNPLYNTDPTLPAFLTRVANGLANKNVPVIRIYTALIVFLISILAALTIIWSGVRGSLISLGRNPLSRKTIFSGMYKTVFTGLGVFIIGLAGIYLLLKI